MFPNIQPYHSEYLAVSPMHSLYIEQVGNPNGVPVVVLHGGPGAGCSPSQRCYFDPAFYRIILFDQRGAGRSTPKSETRDNTLAHLIADIELIRQHLGIKQWLVFGGSWGSLLAVAYGVEYPQQCFGFILRGMFLMRDFEVEWFIHQVRYFCPQEWYTFIDALLALSGTEIANKNNLLAAEIMEIMQYVLEQGDAEKINAMFAELSCFEDKIMLLTPQQERRAPIDMMVVVGRLEHHYFHNNRHEAIGLLDKIERIKHLPCIIVQGRYDVVCPPITAYDVHQAWPGSQLNLVIGGHAGSDPAVAQGLVDAMETFKTLIGA